MANPATSTGAIRPASTVTVPTLIKRIRRKLAVRGHVLQITREGSDARRELGQYAVLNDRFIPISTDCKLPELARFLGVLTEAEQVAQPHQWHSVIINITDSAAISVPHRFDVLASTEADRESLDAIESGRLKEAIDAAMTLMSGWRYVNGPDGKAMAFNRCNVGLMLDAFPHSGRAIAEAISQSGDANA